MKHSVTKAPFQIYSDAPIAKQFPRLLQSSFQANKAIFRSAPKEICIFLCNTPRSFKAKSAYYYVPYAKGLVLRDGSIVMRSQRYAAVPPARYASILSHEMNHVFWLNCFRSWNPYWLCEALACTAGQHLLLTKKELTLKLQRKKSRDISFPFRYRQSIFHSKEELRFLYSLWFHFLDSLALPPRRLVQALQRRQTPIRKHEVDQVFENLMGESLPYLSKRYLEEMTGKGR